MLIIKILVPCICVCLSGCWKYSISNIDKPPRYAYETWGKKGKTQLDIKKDLLECGSVDVYYINYSAYEGIGIYDEDERVNHGFMVALCMGKLGYKKTGSNDLSVDEYCKYPPKRKYYPACIPGVVVSDPSEEKRLKSPYCVMEKEEYRRCKIEIDDWRCGSNNFPLECYSNAEHEQYLKSKISPYPPNKSKPSVNGVGATPESMRMRNQQLEMDLLQSQTRQETNKEMNRMMQK